MRTLIYLTAVSFMLIAGAAQADEETVVELSDTAKGLAPGTRIVVMETEKGTMEIQLFDAETPITAQNFAKLVSDGFYNGMPFHRVVDDFVIQAGDPTLVGIDDLDITLEVEPDQRLCKRGRISMARSYSQSYGYGATSPTQFFIMIKDASHLDPDFCFFGEVINGIEVVDKVKEGDKIIKATLVTVGE